MYKAEAAYSLKHPGDLQPVTKIQSDGGRRRGTADSSGKQRTGNGKSAGYPHGDQNKGGKTDGNSPGAEILAPALQQFGETLSLIHI